MATFKARRTCPKLERVKWWATLESNQACVSARELQSPATPCGLSPTAPLGRQTRNSVSA